MAVFGLNEWNGGSVWIIDISTASSRDFWVPGRAGRRLLLAFIPTRTAVSIHLEYGNASRRHAWGLYGSGAPEVERSGQGWSRKFTSGGGESHTKSRYCFIIQNFGHQISVFFRDFWVFSVLFGLKQCYFFSYDKQKGGFCRPELMASAENAIESSI